MARRPDSSRFIVKGDARFDRCPDGVSLKGALRGRNRLRAKTANAIPA